MNHSTNIIAKNIEAIYAERGKQWLNELPLLIAKIAEENNLTDLKPISNMSYNYVLSGVRNGKSIILKLGLDSKGLAREAHCLQIFAKHGGVTILKSSDGMLLLERAMPGTSLKSFFPNKESDAINILCNVIKKLHSAEFTETNNFPTLKNLLKSLDADLEIPKEILERARKLRDELLNTNEKTVLLHGDLHHENILLNGNHWVVIDPKGILGDPVFDLCAFINNPIPELLQALNPKNIIDQRIEACAVALKFPEQRIRDWHYVQTVLCWAWQLEDNLDPTYFKQLLQTTYSE